MRPINILVSKLFIEKVEVAFRISNRVFPYKQVNKSFKLVQI